MRINGLSDVCSFDLFPETLSIMNLAADIAIGLAFVAGTMMLSIGVYLLTRRIARNAAYERHREMAGAMVSRIATLNGLILALVFAQEMGAYQRLELQTAAEANAVADIYNDAGRYDLVALEPVRQQMVAYLRVVIGEEWSSLGAGRGLSDAAWAAWSTTYETILDLEPQTGRQDSLRDRMLSSIDTIAASRDMRAAEASTSVANFFWLAALSGVVLIAAGHYIYAPERQNLVLLGLFSAYTGAILFLIYGFSNPYLAPASLPPTPLLTLAAEIT